MAEAGAWRVAGQGDTLHLRGVTEQDTGTYILRYALRYWTITVR